MALNEPLAGEVSLCNGPDLHLRGKRRSGCFVGRPTKSIARRNIKKQQKNGWEGQILPMECMQEHIPSGPGE